MDITKTQANKIVSYLFAAIPVIHVQFSTVKDKLFNMEQVAEKQHRSGRNNPKGFSANDAARYFTVKHLFDSLDDIANDKPLYKVVDILHIRNECLYAQAYAIENNAQFQAWYELVKSSDFNKVDYSSMMA